MQKISKTILNFGDMEAKKNAFHKSWYPVDIKLSHSV